MIKFSVKCLTLLITVTLFSLLSALCSNASEVAPVDSIFHSTEIGDIHIAPAIAAGLSILVGFVYCFFGYRYFNPVLFLSGFTIGGLLSYLIIEKLFGDKHWVHYGVWIAFALGGTLIGYFVGSYFRFGIFLVGSLGGVILAFFLNTTVMFNVMPSNPDAILYILIASLGLVSGVLALLIKEPVIIVSTSFFGSNAVAWGVGHFVGGYPSGGDLEALRTQQLDGKWKIDIPVQWWGYFAATIIMFIAGMIVQIKFTKGSKKHKRSRYHTTAVPNTV